MRSPRVWRIARKRSRAKDCDASRMLAFGSSFMNFLKKSSSGGA